MILVIADMSVSLRFLRSSISFRSIRFNFITGSGTTQGGGGIGGGGGGGFGGGGAFLAESGFEKVTDAMRRCSVTVWVR